MLKRLGLASKNESYLINILKFLGVINVEGKKIESAGGIFNHHDDTDFQKAFSVLVKKAYEDLFSLHGDAAWKLDNNGLITFFRQANQTSSIVGSRQASTFKALAALSGQGDIIQPKPRPASGTAPAQPKKPKPKPAEQSLASIPPADASKTTITGAGAGGVGLSVRVEVNLPASADQDTYDRIFKSIRKNLIDGTQTV